MNCDRCGGQTKEKWITSKKTGRQHKMFECLNGCMEGRFTYSFFPPRDQTPKVTSNAVVNKNEQQLPWYVGDIIERLKTIDSKLVEIKGALKIGGRANFTHDEMRPDENTPF